MCMLNARASRRPWSGSHFGASDDTHSVASQRLRGRIRGGVLGIAPATYRVDSCVIRLKEIVCTTRIATIRTMYMHVYMYMQM